MSLALVLSRANVGITAPQVTVEVHISPGLPAFSIVGLPETVVKESKDRVRSAIMNSSFEFPYQRITVNLAPADLPKEGGRFDLPIALGILAATDQIPKEALGQIEFAGELALSGELRPFQSALTMAMAAARESRALIVPEDNAEEAALSEYPEIFPARHLLEVCAHLHGKAPLASYQPDIKLVLAEASVLDMAEVQGQALAKRALLIAAAGRHNLLMMGPPGAGKTMLASRLPGILPALSKEEALEVAAIYSISGRQAQKNTWRVRPFRHPHHTASSVALVGGGSPPKPGEISLAHRGVLFLDELPEFNRHVLEALREPLESGCVMISRAAHQREFPAHFQLIAAMNPCPCGYLGSTLKPCRCTQEQVQRYRAKVSGPLLDRIDLHIEVKAMPPELLFSSTKQTRVLETSAMLRDKVSACLARQQHRQAKTNSDLSPDDLQQVCALGHAEQESLKEGMQRMKLSARSANRVLKIARTIADLEACDTVTVAHLMEAFSYRVFDREARYS